MRRQLVYYSPGLTGGIADYAKKQADAIARAGIEVRFLASAGFQPSEGDAYQLTPTLMAPATSSARGRLRSRFRTARYILANVAKLRREVAESGCQHVLFSAYGEYLAPLWAYKMRDLNRRGVVFGAVVHDPVRDAVVGPVWWHRWSIAEGYSFLREAFVHDAVRLDTGRPQPRLRTTVAPHGAFSPPGGGGGKAREDLDLPPGAKVILAFGHIRDNKNLDLAIRALAKLPDACLLVAGNEMIARQRPAAYYQELARALGVEDRCRWRIGYIPDSDVAGYFKASDLVLLTYNSQFRSASGVLNVAAGDRKPCIASSGESNLRKVVSEYRLGAWVEPDSVEALAAGIRRCLDGVGEPEWDRYEREQSWGRNAEIVIDKMFGPAA